MTNVVSLKGIRETLESKRQASRPKSVQTKRDELLRRWFGSELGEKIIDNERTYRHSDR
jgi:hypothetical protein